MPELWDVDSCQNLPLGALNIRSAPSVLVGALFKKFVFFFNTPRTGRINVCEFIFQNEETQRK